MSRRAFRVSTVVSVLAAGALALAGCSGGDAPKENASAKPKADVVSAIDVGEPTTLTPVNSTLDFGDVAWVSDRENRGVPAAAMTVLSVSEAPASVLQLLSKEERAKAKDVTPYVIHWQATYAPGASTGNNPTSTFAVSPLHEDGSDAQYITAPVASGGVTATGAADCPAKPLQFDEKTGTGLACVIALAEPGHTIAGAKFSAATYVMNMDPTMGDPTYAASPITWMRDAKPTPLAVEPIDIPAPTTTETAPGTALKLGEPAQLSLLDDANTVVGVSVLDIVPGVADDLASLENADDFAGLTPTSIVVQVRYPNAEAAKEQRMPPLFPVDETGADAQWLTSTTGFADISGAPGTHECPLTLPVYDATTLTSVMCITALSKDTSVTSMQYVGERYGAIMATGEKGYLDKPVTWQ